MKSPRTILLVLGLALIPAARVLAAECALFGSTLEDAPSSSAPGEGASCDPARFAAMAAETRESLGSLDDILAIEGVPSGEAIQKSRRLVDKLGIRGPLGPMDDPEIASFFALASGLGDRETLEAWLAEDRRRTRQGISEWNVSLLRRYFQWRSEQDEVLGKLTESFREPDDRKRARRYLAMLSKKQDLALNIDATYLRSIQSLESDLRRLAVTEAWLRRQTPDYPACLDRWDALDGMTQLRCARLRSLEERRSKLCLEIELKLDRHQVFRNDPILIKSELEPLQRDLAPDGKWDAVFATAYEADPRSREEGPKSYEELDVAFKKALADHESWWRSRPLPPDPSWE